MNTCLTPISPGRACRLSSRFSMCALLCLSACTSTFVSSWRAPDAQPLQVGGAKVAAAVMAQDGPSRRMAEDTLAQEISKHGAQGVALYTLVPDTDLSDEGEVRSELEQAGVAGLVIMRPVGVDKEVVATPSAGPTYPGYWGGYHYGWANPWPSGIHTNTIVYVETQVYSLDQNKLVWSGQSKTTNPQQVDNLVEELAAATAKELERQGLLTR
ncbi:MAG TPA: hypothetical protein VFX02_03150 [Gammaproteobacteria bacterium]|nr:hypothetical protein [Gammaproteobacteria bacterium]